MVQTIVTICATALLSSILTLGLSYYWFRRKIKNELRSQLDTVATEIREKVRQGVFEAGVDLLPKYRAEVRQGFKEAMSDTVKPEMIEKTAKSMADIGTSLVENSLKVFFGTKEK
jgi:hypothetical protein